MHTFRKTFLIASLLLAFTLANAAIGHEISLTNVSYDPVAGTTTFSYHVVSGTKPSISHWNMEWCDEAYILDTSEPYVYGLDPTTGVTGIKFDEGYEDGESRTVWIKLSGIWPTETANVTFKAGQNVESTTVDGPVCGELGSLGDTIWEDTNGDGVQNPGETGIAGIEVKLYLADGTFVGTATTDSNGKYVFNNLAAGSYYVDVVDATVPAGLTLTTNNDPTEPIELSAGENYVDADFGYQPEQGQNGTTLTAEKTAEASLAQTFSWDIEKTAIPASWNLFQGDQGTSQYTVSVTKTIDGELVTVASQICVTNGGAETTENLTIYDHIQYKVGAGQFQELPDASLTLTPNQLAPAESKCYDYTIEFEPLQGAVYRNVATITITNHSGHLGEPFGPEPKADFEVPTTPTSMVNGTIHVDDSNGDSWEFSESGSVQYSKVFNTAGNFENTATIRETGESATANVEVNVYALEVSKTAATSYQRYYAWTIDKTGSATELALGTDETGPVSYTVVVAATSHDADYLATGMISIHNPAPIPATINSVEDVLDGISANVQCSQTFPYTLAAGATLECPYSAELPDASSLVNTATAELQNYAYAYQYRQLIAENGTTDFSGTADVIFSQTPTDEIDEQINVTDNKFGDLGMVSAGDAPKTFEYLLNVGPYSEPNTYEFINVATFNTNDTQTQGSDSWAVIVNVVDDQECPIELTQPETRVWHEGETDVISNIGTVPVTFTYAMDWVTLDGRVEFHRETVTLKPGESLTIHFPPEADWLANGPAAIQIWETDPTKATYTYQVFTTVWVDEGNNIGLCGEKDFGWGRFFNVDGEVPCEPPVADFTAKPTYGIGPLEVHFADLSANAREWLWDFGDGETSTEQHPIHVYNTVRKYYTVQLTVYGCNAQDMMTKANYITVNKAVEVLFEAAPIAGPSGLKVQFTNNTGGNANKFLWEYGDGTTEEFRSDIAHITHPTHIYELPGSYDVTLKTWGNGGMDELTLLGLVYVDTVFNYLNLEWVDAGETYPEEGWENAIDHDIYGHGAVVGAKAEDAWGVFKITDDGVYDLHQIRLLTDTIEPDAFKTNLTQVFEIWTSEDGTTFEKGYEGVSVAEDGVWEVFELAEPKTAKFIKILLVSARGEAAKYHQIAEIQIFGLEHQPAAFSKSNLTSALQNVAPTDFHLAQNFPNPFNPETVILYQIPEASAVKIEIFNTQGQRVETLVDSRLEAGIHQAIWSGADATGNKVGSGLYFYRLSAIGEKQGMRIFTKKMLLMK